MSVQSCNRSTTDRYKTSLLVGPTSPHPAIFVTEWEAESFAANRTKTGTSLQPVCISPLNKSKSCYVSGQNIAFFPWWDESAVGHQSFMSLWFLSHVKGFLLLFFFFYCSQLQTRGLLLDPKKRTESGLDWKKRASQSLEGGRTRIHLWSGRIGGDGQQWRW